MLSSTRLRSRSPHLLCRIVEKDEGSSQHEYLLKPQGSGAVHCSKQIAPEALGMRVAIRKKDVPRCVWKSGRVGELLAAVQ